MGGLSSYRCIVHFALRTGETYYRWFDTYNSGLLSDSKRIVTLKLSAIQTHRGDDELPPPDLLDQYKVTLYLVDSEGDKVLVSNETELSRVLTRNSVTIMAKVQHVPDPASLAGVKPLPSEGEKSS